jgi:hypothetical protein
VADTNDHIINFGDSGFGIQHPAPCRPNLLACPFQAAAQRLDGPPVAPGRYVCVLDPWGELSIQREASDADVLAITGVVIAQATLDRIREVLEYVSGGRNYVDVESYPDAAARLALAELQDAIKTQTTSPAHAHTDDCLCVMVPMEVEGASECHYCGVHGQYGKPCGDRCDIARAEVVDDRASVQPDPGLDVYDVAGPEPSTDVLVLHDPAGADINGGYLHRCAESGWSWSDNADSTPLPYITEGLEWGVPGGSVRERAQGPLVVVRRSAPGDKENTRG